MSLRIQDGEGDAKVRIASLARYFPDDLEGQCSRCGAPIFYRPEPPFIVEFLCLTCAMPLLADPGTEFAVSTKTARFVREHFGPGKDQP